MIKFKKKTGKKSTKLIISIPNEKKELKKHKTLSPDSSQDVHQKGNGEFNAIEKFLLKSIMDNIHDDEKFTSNINRLDEVARNEYINLDKLSTVSDSLYELYTKLSETVGESQPNLTQIPSDDNIISFKTKVTSFGEMDEESLAKSMLFIYDGNIFFKGTGTSLRNIRRYGIKSPLTFAKVLMDRKSNTINTIEEYRKQVKDLQITVLTEIIS